MLHLLRFVEFCVSKIDKLHVVEHCGALLKTISLEFTLDEFGTDADELELCVSIIDALLAYQKAIELLEEVPRASRACQLGAH